MSFSSDWGITPGRVVQIVDSSAPGPLTASTGGGGGAAYAYKGNSGDLSGSGSFSLDIGTASADRNVLLGIIGNSAPSFSATVNGVSLTSRIFYNETGASFPLCFLSGLVTAGSGSQSIAVTGAGETVLVCHVWTMTGLGSNTPQATVSGPSGAGQSLSVNAGDFLFAVTRIGGATPMSWNLSTQAPTAVHPDNSYGGLSSADWTISATNAAFNLQPDTAGTDFIGIQFR